MNRSQRWTGVKTVILAVIAIVLMWFDYRNAPFHQLRTRLTFIIMSPVHTIIQAPFHFVGRLGGGIESHHHLVKTKAQLETETLQLQEKLEQMKPLAQENEKLRTLLAARQHYDLQSVAVEVVAVDTSRFAQQIIINRGSHDGVSAGQAVVDGNGIIGQVVQTSASRSQVMLISDKNSRVPVQDSRSGFEAIAVGEGVTGKLSLLDVTHSADIRVGDQLVSSGLGQRYPHGYPVATITTLKHHHNNQTVSVTAKPLASLTSSRQLLLLSSRQVSALLLPTESDDVMKKTIMAGLEPSVAATGEQRQAEHVDHEN
ncbi:MAG: rod shape-determining protein MreC [Gammaproteobacteria bacterium]|nr:rod shape-determining protein MreC [Gammaproteobacteria bacterium]